MPEVEYATVVAAPVDRVWSYVEDLTHWCHLMVGYQALEIVDDRQSIWTLRGDVGILTREVRIRVDITEWVPRERVRFVVTGLTERLEGGGAFLMGASEPAGEDAAAAGTEPKPRRDGLLRRLRFRIARALLRRVGRKAAAAHATQVADGAATSTAPARDAAARNAAARNGTAGSAAAGPATGGTSRLVFQLKVSPLGPMAPMLDLLMAPMLEPAAQNLADGIKEALES
jgi:carbon monoxide dehydrogenase subunit G